MKAELMRGNGAPKAILGPTFKIDIPLPCGCRVCRDDGTSKLRMWYCPTHAAAFEVLEALRLNLSVLDHVIEQASSSTIDVSAAMEVGMKARAAIRKATPSLY